MKNKAIFNICPDGEFFGRSMEIDYVFARGTEVQKHTPNIYLSGNRWMGKTEVLRRVHRKLFWGQASVVPVYYQFRGGQSVSAFAEDFIKETAKQYMAFMLRNPELARVEVSLDKLERLVEENAEETELPGIVRRHREAREARDLTAELRNAVGAPALLSLNSSAPVFLMLDDLDAADRITSPSDGPEAGGELAGALVSGNFSFIAASLTASSLTTGLVKGHIETLELTGLKEEEAVSMLLELSRQYHLETSSEVLVQAARKLGGNPMYLKNLIWAAHRAGRDIMDIRDLADLYSGELVAGNTGFALGGAIRLNGLNDLRVLHAACTAYGSTSEEELKDRFRYGHEELKDMLSSFATMALVTNTLGSIKWAGDGVMRDYIIYMYETRLKGKSPEEVKTRLVRDMLKESFSSRGEEVRGRFKEEVSQLVSTFDGNMAQKVFFDHPSFASKYKDGLLRAVEGGEAGDIRLPHVVGCFDARRLEVGEAGQPVFIAHGFQNDRYDAGNEVAWLICVKEAITPVNIGDVENFLRRAAFLRENFRSIRVIRWMVGMEGFTEEAARRLSKEGVYSTDTVQLGMLRGALNAAPGTKRKGGGAVLGQAKEFEIVLPGSSKSELVAARAAEEIGTEMGFDDNAIGQIRAALVEACINAFEHSRTKSSKVHLKFIADNDRLTINVQNGGSGPGARGLKRAIARAGRMPQKRGWGVELMKGLMDEVRFEELVEGTRIVLVKYLAGKRSGEV